MKTVVIMPTMYALAKRLRVIENEILAFPEWMTVHSYYNSHCMRNKKTSECLTNNKCHCGFFINSKADKVATTLNYYDSESSFRLAKYSGCKRVLIVNNELRSSIGHQDINDGWLIDININEIERVKTKYFSER